MAGIVLTPGETFEHSHREPSTSTLVEGTATIMVAGNTTMLETGKPMPVPANTAHTLENVGENRAVVQCGYGPSST
jgi:quercetin dioxygenase-like cupin family protein